MIGGIDIEIPTQLGPAALDRGTRTILRAWPEAVIVDADTGAKLQDLAGVSFTELRELLIYRDPAAEARWELEGAIPELRDTMVHLLADDELITVVVDDPSSPEMQSLLEDLHHELSGHSDVHRDRSQNRTDVPGDVPATRTTST